ncbi:MAG TPA: O-antigen ligase family protein [Chitinophagaceae bacterium]|nr:O-antigen ligase family protein [Chitinophagaceae bacterium]
MGTKQQKTAGDVKSTNFLNDLPAKAIFLFYVIVELIPNWGAIDVMGSQWLYISILNIICLLYVLKNRSSFTAPAQHVTRSIISILYLLVFVLSGISILFAFNKTESIVVFARITNTLAGFFVLAVIFYNKPKLIHFMAMILSLLLTYQCLQTIFSFFDGIKNGIALENVIYNLKGNAGNKNVLAASLAIKIPFLFYFYYYSKSWGKIIAPIVFLFASFSLFVINSRAFFLTLFILMAFYGLFCIVLYSRQEGAVKKIVVHFFAFVLPFVVSFIVSENLIKEYAAKSGNYDKAYGTVEQRIGSIEFTEKGTGDRFFLWKNAIKYIKEKPVTGAGIGNWKLISVADDNKFYDDNAVSKHAHNDFLELAAEAGIPAGVIYLSLFIVAAWGLLKVLIAKGEQERKSRGLIWLMVLAVYFIDAALNFPAERPVMQLYFMLLFAGIITLNSSAVTVKKDKRQRTFFTILISLLVVISFVALWIALLNYRSMVLQTKALRDTIFSKDLYTTKPKYRSDDFISVFPAIPNISAFGVVPIAHIKARYLLAEGKDESALEYLQLSRKLVPDLGADETMLARYYLEKNKLDSAYFFIAKAFELSSRGKYTYQILQRIALSLKDSALIEESFKRFIAKRNENWAWNDYINQWIKLKYPVTTIEVKVDTALKFFPADTFLLRVKKNINDIKQKMQMIKNMSPEKKDPPVTVNTQNIFDEGQKAFNNKEYKKAIALFLEYYKYKAEDPAGPLNAGLCYFQLSDYNAALPLLKTSAAMPKSADGKAEFFMGAVYYKLKNNEEACRYFRLSDQKKYPEAKAMLENICKKKN